MQESQVSKRDWALEKLADFLAEPRVARWNIRILGIHTQSHDVILEVLHNDKRVCFAMGWTDVGLERATTGDVYRDIAYAMLCIGEYVGKNTPPT